MFLPTRFYQPTAALGGVAARSEAYQAIADETDGLALSFTDTFFLNSTGHYGSARVKDTSTPANNYNSHPFGLLSYPGASKKWVRGPSGMLIESDPALTLPYEWDENGDLLGIRVEEQRTNLLTQSEQFDNWDTDNVTITANSTTAPDGTTTADTLKINNDTSGRIRNTATVSSGATVTWSCFVKNSVSGFFRVFVHGSSTSNRFGGWFNLETGEWATEEATGSGVLDSTFVTEYDDGWYRIGFTGNADGTSYTVFAYLTATDNSSTRSGIPEAYLWGAQLEAGSFPTSYIQTAGSTVTRAADVIGPALDAFPWNEGNGVLTVNDEEVEPSDDGTILVLEPPDGDTHIRTVKWIPEAA